MYRHCGLRNEFCLFPFSSFLLLFLPFLHSFLSNSFLHLVLFAYIFARDAVVHLSANDISGILATVQMHCPDKSPRQMWKSVRQLCEMVSDSMVSQVDVKLAEAWFLCWESMLTLRGTGWICSVFVFLCDVSSLIHDVVVHGSCSLMALSLASTKIIWVLSSYLHAEGFHLSLLFLSTLSKVRLFQTIDLFICRSKF